jgi:hypothetical protein
VPPGTDADSSSGLRSPGGLNNFLTLARHKGRMDGSTPWLSLLAKAGIALLVLREVRGFVLAGPVLYGMYEAGGTAMAIWLGICSLAGIALSVVVPMFIARRLKLI